MNAIRDSIYEKLLRFFSDSQSPRQTPHQESEARPHAKDGSSLTSVLSLLPSVRFGWFRLNANTNDTGSDSFKWRSKSFSLKEKPLDRCTESDNEYETVENGGLLEEYGELGSTRIPNQTRDPFGIHSENREPSSATSSSGSSDVFEDVATPCTFEKSTPNLRDESLFISPDLYQFLEASLPNIVKGCQWVLLYSTARHGVSLHTLVRKSASHSGPCLLITGDKQGAVFGGLLDCPLKPTAKRKYQGTIHSFVFTTTYGEPRIFRPTGANRYFYLCLNDLLALGGGANFALCLSEDLLTGTSGPCETFGNLCLAHDREFELKNVELWGFAHPCQRIK